MDGETSRLVTTAAGYVTLTVTTRGVRRSSLPRPMAPVGALAAADDELARRLAAFYDGGPFDLSDVPLDLPGETHFQAAVRAIVRAIPPGQTMTYGEVAAAAGHPGAARAVGQVMATNPVPPFIPCHRVVAAGGGLGGFGGGLALKAALLEREGKGQ